MGGKGKKISSGILVAKPYCLSCISLFDFRFSNDRKKWSWLVVWEYGLGAFFGHWLHLTILPAIRENILLIKCLKKKKNSMNTIKTKRFVCHKIWNFMNLFKFEGLKAYCGGCGGRYNWIGLIDWFRVFFQSRKSRQNKRKKINIEKNTL